MYKRVLLCYDGTEEGRRALREGAYVALAMQAEARLLAVVRTTAMLPPEGVNELHLRGEHESAQNILDEGVARLRDMGLHAQGQLVIGDPLKEIPACARALHADVIVLGHRHRGPLARWWSNSEGASMLDVAPCSVLITCAGP